MTWRTLCGRLSTLRNQSRLLIAVLVAFVLGYLLIGYLLFYKGLEYVYAFPVIGLLLSQRILYLIFGFFFIMLIFSNVITAYTTLFKNRETEWFLSLPIPHRYVYLWKFLEALIISSWALIFLSAPLMAAFGRVHGVEVDFYFKVLLVYVPFVVLPAVFGSWLILLIVRLLAKRWVKFALMIVFAAGLLVITVGMQPASEEDAVSVEQVVSFERLLQHTRLSLNPLLPSAWAAQSVVAWSQGINNVGIFYFLLLSSNALFAVLLGVELAGRKFYSSWSYFATHRTASLHRRNQRERATRRTSAGWWGWLIEAFPLGGRPLKALILKDGKIFWRDPSQWTQFAVFFGLLCIYILNLRNVSYDFENQFWSVTVSYLNLGACTLTLSTLTTRFVFPQFSLEGRRLWIIGLAPIGLPKVLLQKFWMAFLSATLITCSLMLASSLTLGLPPLRVIFFLTAITLMSAALCGLAVGLGAIFPNLKEDNPSKIVSGFGGTLCLVLSFLYIIGNISLIVLPAALELSAPQMPAATRLLWTGVAYALSLVISLAALLVPMTLALRRVRNLQF